VRVVGGGQPGSDVKELADARGRQLARSFSTALPALYPDVSGKDYLAVSW